MNLLSFTSGLLIVFAISPIQGADDVEALKFFETEIRPLLASSCNECHGAEKSKGGLRLDHIDHIRKGGETGPAIVAGEAEKSLLIEAVRRGDPDFAMPPKQADALSESEIAKLEKWIKMGAPWPVEIAKGGEVDEHGFTAEDRAWWAIQPVVDPAIPDAGAGWALNDLDRFVARGLAEAKLIPALEADRHELVRRGYFDLHGLPPTPEQVSAFVNDKNPKAWENLIQHLLESPRYGEHWAQHWLDIVRYAESDGYRGDFFRPQVSKYRDYVIESFNADKPYDQFVKEQLAGDEIDPDNPDVLIGTAFLRHGIYEHNQRNARMHWELILNEATNVTGEVFLGIGIGCAQCHDHKFDPLLQKDYFALQAFLSTICWPDDTPLSTLEERMAFDEKQLEWEAATKLIREEIAELLKGQFDNDQTYTVKQFPPDIQEMYGKPQGDRTAFEEQMVMLVDRQVRAKRSNSDPKKYIDGKSDEIKARYAELQAKLKEFEAMKPDPLPLAFTTTDVGPKPAKTFLNSRSGKVEVAPEFLTLLGQPAPKISPTATTTGRRTALANWIASPDNPLATRVIVNRIWQHHFGVGIVPTPNDFGTLGEDPSHPKLLDWLTRRFLDGGWKMKEMHKLIMTSSAYRQTAQREPTSVENIADPTNRLLWRFPPRRLSAEQVRDAMLAVSGELQHQEAGPSVDGNSPKRSVFVKKIRNTPDSVLGGFDAPMGFDSAPTRTTTTTPTQSLMLVNGDWALKRAQAFARQLLSGKKAITEAEIGRAYEIAYGRAASNQEISTALDFVSSQSAFAPTKPVVVDKFPDETGLRPIGQHFENVKEVELGERALWLQPGSKFEQLHLAENALEGDEFTIEAVAILDAIQPDASVNTLVSRWNGNQKSRGWTFGVTSAQSSYQPKNFIMQLVGDNFQGTQVYEVVASDLRVPLQTPVYLAAAVSTKIDLADESSGTVTFYMKDLANPEAKLETVVVPHGVIESVQLPSIKLLIGGRDQKGHLWDGQLARLAISKGILPPEQLLVGSKAAEAPRAFDFSFSGEDGEHPATGALWVRQEKPEPDTGGVPPRVFEAMTDFCHALFNSNEFLYLH
ncbi:MAG: hypothetical protein ACI8UO_000209 [Verrucomicrobiales bacterium]|jgi:hypothetical protein